MRRLIVTGANGAGKSHVGCRARDARPEVPLVSFDAMKLTEGWRQRPRAEIDAVLERLVAEEAWILEGGPSLLPLALPRADAVIWLDPPERVRAWRLALRPWRHRGRTRPELPEGNVDWPAEQYRFAWRSLRHGARTRAHLAARLAEAECRVWRCVGPRDVAAALEAWQGAA